jgi:putative membrane protein
MVTAAAAANVPTNDINFATTAAAAGHAEVTEAQLALKQAQRPDVRAFAQRMIADHTSANGKLAEIADQLGIQLPANPNADDQKKISELSALSGVAFDKAYVADQVAAHDAAVSLFSTESKQGQERQLKAFASSTLPTLKSHQMMIKEMATH